MVSFFSVPFGNVQTLKECFLPTHVPLGVPLRSPFRRAVNVRLEQMKEAGIVRDSNLLIYV